MAQARLDIGADGGAIQAVFETINGLLAGQEALFARVGGASEAAARSAATGFEAATRGAEAAAEAVEQIQDGLDNVERSASAVGSAFSFIAGGPVAALKSAQSAISGLYSSFVRFQDDSIRLWAENSAGVTAWKNSIREAGLELGRLGDFNRALARNSPASEFELQEAQRGLIPAFGSSESDVESATRLAIDVALSTNQSLSVVAQALADFQRSGKVDDGLLTLGLHGAEIDSLAEVVRLQESLPKLEAKLADFQGKGIRAPSDLDELKTLLAELSRARSVQGRDVRAEVFDILRNSSTGAASEAAFLSPFDAVYKELERFQYNFGESLVESSLPLAQAQADALLRVNDALEAGSSFGEVLAELPGAIRDTFADSPLRVQLAEFLGGLRDILLSALDALAEVAVESARVVGVYVEDAIVKATRGFAESLGIGGATDVESQLEASRRRQDEAALPAFRLIAAAARGGDAQAAEALERIAAARGEGGFGAAQSETIRSLNELRRTNSRFSNLQGPLEALPVDISRFDSSGVARALGRGISAAGRVGASVDGLQRSAPEFAASAFEEASRRTGGAVAADPGASGPLSVIAGEFRRYTQLIAQQAHAPREATL